MEIELAHILALIQTHGKSVAVSNMGSVWYTYEATPLQWALMLLGLMDEDMSEYDEGE